MALWIVAEILLAIAGFFVAAELTARGVESIEPIMGQGMAGGVILGLLGALPETIFVVIATLSSSHQVAVGSALGGNIILFTLGIGLVGIAHSLKWKRPIVMKEDYKVEIYFLMASTILLIAVMFYGSLDRISGGVLFLLYVIYVAYRYAVARKKMDGRFSVRRRRKLITEGGAYIAAGMVIVLLLSGTFVSTISDVSGMIGISPLWLALVISPLAADIDENISANRITMRKVGGGSTAIVSFVGGKLQNNTVLLGLIGLLSSGGVAIGGSMFDFGAVVAVNLLAIAVILRGKLDYKESILLVMAYAIVIAAAFVLG